MDVLSLGGIYIYFFNCDMFNVVNVYLGHLKLCGVCIDGRRYVCSSECNVVSNECNEPTSCLVQPIGTHGGEVMYFGCVCFRGELGFLNCDNICMYVVNKEYDETIGFGLYQSCENRGVLDVCLCLGFGGVVGIGGECVRGGVMSV